MRKLYVGKKKCDAFAKKRHLEEKKKPVAGMPLGKTPGVYLRGPPGPAGTNGVDGKDGKDGTNGTN